MIKHRGPLSLTISQLLKLTNMTISPQRRLKPVNPIASNHRQPEFYE